MYEAPKTVNVLVARVLPTGTSFGYRADNAGQVFIPSSLRARAPFVEGDVIAVRVVPNPLHMLDENKAPEKAIWIDTGEAPQPVMPAHTMPDFLRSDTAPEPVEETEDETPRDVTAEVFEFMQEEGGLWNQSEVVAALFGPGWGPVERARVSSSLRVLHRRGDLIRLAFYTKPDSSRASREFYTAEKQPWNNVALFDDED